jgi:hypothetical protein
MAFGTLQNFGVPVGGARVGILMPKVKNRFQVTLSNFGNIVSSNAFTQQAITVSRPNVTMAPQAIHSYNSVAYYAGKAEWETITVTVRDDMSNTVSKLVGAQLTTQMNFFQQTVTPAANGYKFTMLINTMDGASDDVFLEQWIYEGCFLSAVNYESFDYSSSDAMTIEMTVRFDNATQNEDIPAAGIMPDQTIAQFNPVKNSALY